MSGRTPSRKDRGHERTGVNKRTAQGPGSKDRQRTGVTKDRGHERTGVTKGPHKDRGQKDRTRTGVTQGPGSKDRGQAKDRGQVSQVTAQDQHKHRTGVKDRGQKKGPGSKGPGSGLTSNSICGGPPRPRDPRGLFQDQGPQECQLNRSTYCNLLILGRPRRIRIDGRSKPQAVWPINPSLSV